METDRDADHWIKMLRLKEHPEGGFYSETYRSVGQIPAHALTNDFQGPRTYSTAIYYLLRSSDRSKFHRIRSDEVWHFYAGNSLTLYVFMKGNLHRFSLGRNPGESFQIVVPANCWFGAKVHGVNSFTLAGCTVSPGFDYNDFELADREYLLKCYPDHEKEIKLLT